MWYKYYIGQSSIRDISHASKGFLIHCLASNKSSKSDSRFPGSDGCISLRTFQHGFWRQSTIFCSQFRDVLGIVRQLRNLGFMFIPIPIPTACASIGGCLYPLKVCMCMRFDREGLVLLAMTGGYRYALYGMLLDSGART